MLFAGTDVGTVRSYKFPLTGALHIYIHECIYVYIYVRVCIYVFIYLFTYMYLYIEMYRHRALLQLPAHGCAPSIASRV